jgi:casein kinase II subunit alpha
VLGTGKYSEVFEGYFVNEPTKKLVIKLLKPVRIDKIRREISILQKLDHPNIIKLYDVVLNPGSNYPALIMEYVDTGDLSRHDLFDPFTDEDIKFYVYKLFKALDYAHSRGIMHRDLKYGNIMIDHAARDVKLIDWGLAEYFHMTKDYNVKVATREYKTPELLTGLRTYDYAVDVFSLGSVFAGWIFKKYPFFTAEDNYDMLKKHAKVLGSQGLRDFHEKYDGKLTKDQRNIIYENEKSYPKKSWFEFVNEDNQHTATEMAIDLLEKMMVYDHADRITPKDAMEHPYFDSVRD